MFICTADSCGRGGLRTLLFKVFVLSWSGNNVSTEMGFIYGVTTTKGIFFPIIIHLLNQGTDHLCRLKTSLGQHTWSTVPGPRGSFPSTSIDLPEPTCPLPSARFSAVDEWHPAASMQPPALLPSGQTGHNPHGPQPAHTAVHLACVSLPIGVEKAKGLTEL